MDKRKFIAAVALSLAGSKKSVITAETVSEVLEGISKVAAQQLSMAGEVRIPGIVNLTVKSRAERKARNPKNGNPVVIPAGRIVKAKTVNSLNDTVVMAAI